MAEPPYATKYIAVKLSFQWCMIPATLHFYDLMRINDAMRFPENHLYSDNATRNLFWHYSDVIIESNIGLLFGFFQPCTYHS